jgi:hypothetical protein
VEERKAKEAAAKAETELKDVLTSLQVGLEGDCFCGCGCGQEVEEQRKAKEAAAKAETDPKDVLASLQVSLP